MPSSEQFIGGALLILGWIAFMGALALVDFLWRAVSNVRAMVRRERERRGKP